MHLLASYEQIKFEISNSIYFIFLPLSFFTAMKIVAIRNNNTTIGKCTVMSVQVS
jgi:hypothetical protein